MTIISLNELCASYAELLKTIPIEMAVYDGLYVPSTYSNYVLQIDLCAKSSVDTYRYVGCTSLAPSKRATLHKSSLRCCRITTHIGLSRLFTPALTKVTNINMTFTVVHGGLTARTAKMREKELSDNLKLLFGEKVLTSPKGS